jgi:DNA-binding PadR family transcriptional regulator
MLLPSRTAVLNQMYDQREFDVKKIMAELKPQYGHEKQFNEKLYLEHLMALEANGLVELTNYCLDEQGELLMSYTITEEGRTTVEKYIDKAYRLV